MLCILTWIPGQIYTVVKCFVGRLGVGFSFNEVPSWTRTLSPQLHYLTRQPVLPTPTQVSVLSHLCLLSPSLYLLNWFKSLCLSTWPFWSATGHLIANQSKTLLMFFSFAKLGLFFFKFPYLTSGWTNFNRGNVILEQWISFGVTQEQLPSLPHPSALHSWGVSWPLSTSQISLLCCAQPNFSPLVRVKFCHLWDFNHHSLQCQLFSKGTNTMYKARMKKNTRLLILLI